MSDSSPVEVVTAADATTAAAETANRFARLLAECSAELHVAVSGGSVATAVLPAFVATTEAAGLDWSRVHVWFADERFVPRGHAERNAVPVVEALRGARGFDLANLHTVLPSDAVADAREAADAYEHELRAEVPALDLVLLGAGPDGHTASLFPAHPSTTHPEPGRFVVAVDDSPKPPPQRVTLTLDAIRAARRVWAIVTGAGKADAVALALDPHAGGDPVRSPLGASLRVDGPGPADGRLLVVDVDAATRLAETVD